MVMEASDEEDSDDDGDASNDMPGSLIANIGHRGLRMRDLASESDCDHFNVWQRRAKVCARTLQLVPCHPHAHSSHRHFTHFYVRSLSQRSHSPPVGTPSL